MNGSIPAPSDADLARADHRAGALGFELTPIRRRVLAQLIAAGRPVGAYRLIEALAAERGKVQPPTVYRALDFLVERGLVHRIESLNAFLACPVDSCHGATARGAIFLICGRCGSGAEHDDGAIVGLLDELAATAGFRIERRTIEVSGLCRDCTAS